MLWWFPVKCDWRAVFIPCCVTVYMWVADKHSSAISWLAFIITSDIDKTRTRGFGFIVSVSWCFYIINTEQLNKWNKSHTVKKESFQIRQHCAETGRCCVELTPPLFPSSCFAMATDHQSKPIPRTRTRRATGHKASDSYHRYEPHLGETVSTHITIAVILTTHFLCFQEGMRQHLELGQFLRKRYTGFLNESYHRHEVGDELSRHMTSHWPLHMHMLIH